MASQQDLDLRGWYFAQRVDHGHTTMALSASLARNPQAAFIVVHPTQMLFPMR